jgi:hypothetical protein
VVTVCRIFGIDGIRCAKGLGHCGCVWDSALWVCFVVVESCVICAVIGCDSSGVDVRKSGFLDRTLSHRGGESLWIWVGCFLVVKWLTMSIDAFIRSMQWSIRSLQWSIVSL